MNTVVIEHVPVTDLPEQWCARLATAAATLVTVRIEEEAPPPPLEPFVSDDPAFGMWRDREDLSDVAGHVRKLRAPRFLPDGSPDDE
ncbi:MAG: hypothetical protein MUF30_06605 [Burkholderiales bacterium]|jgi:hypothetical protein|nr:hypothetical protein [Burkholderiales bacterium]